MDKFPRNFKYNWEYCRTKSTECFIPVIIGFSGRYDIYGDYYDGIRTNSLGYSFCCSDVGASCLLSVIGQIGTDLCFLISLFEVLNDNFSGLIWHYSAITIITLSFDNDVAQVFHKKVTCQLKK